MMSPLVHKKLRPVSFNPLIADPSRTGPIRRAWMAQVEARFRELKRRVYQKLVTGLTSNVGLVVNEPYPWPSSPAYLQEFKQWMWVQHADLFYPEGEDSWWREYIVKSWRQGADKAYNAWQNKSEFLRSSFNHPVAVNKVKLLAARVLSELEGVTQEMATKMTRALVDGMAIGQSPREVASLMSKAVEGITKQRALTIARTETVRAHAEGQLDTLENLGMSHVGVAVEWSTSGMGLTAKKNPSPCPLCAPMSGVVLSLAEAHGMIPRHPNCMCSFIPANVGEDTQGQTRGYQKITMALRQSIRAGVPKQSKKTAAQLAQRSNWAGATAKIGKNRPVSVFNYFPAQPRKDGNPIYAGEGVSSNLAKDVETAVATGEDYVPPDAEYDVGIADGRDFKDTQ